MSYYSTTSHICKLEKEPMLTTEFSVTDSCLKNFYYSENYDYQNIIISAEVHYSSLDKGSYFMNNIIGSS